MADSKPPAYSEKGVIRDSSDVPPPPPTYTVQTVTAETYTAPTQFNIGSQTTPKPLVDISQLKGHLALLHAFAELKKRVEGLQEPIPQMPADLEKRWAWFVGLAVERFDIWCHALQDYDAENNWEETLPPVDVMMVWHAYMLNPMWYGEDCLRIPACQILESVGIRFAGSLNEGLRYALSNPPSQVRLYSWRTKTLLPFDPVESSYKSLTKTIRCPQCRVDIVVDMMTPKGTGYLQKKFLTSCPRHCGIPEITKETLALRKIAVDLTSDSESFLAGTLLNPSFESAASIGEEIKAKICKKAKKASDHSSHIKKNADPCFDIMKYPEFSLSKLKAKILTSQMGSSRRLAARILSGYVDDKAYSVELPGAVLRQGSFVKKMHDLKWTSPRFFDSAIDELALHHAISRYHAFLDLMTSSPSSFFVPTLDIDLVWHTHQLMAADYQTACIKYMGRFIDHDDKVEGLVLSSGFDATCDAWKDRFNVQYSHCGCPIAGDGIGTKLLKLVFAAEFVPPSHLLPFNRPDLLASTHPSDHNAVHFRSQNKESHKLAKTKYEELAHGKEREAKEFAEDFAIKAAKKAANAKSGKKTEKRPDYLPILDPPHLHHHLLQTSFGTNEKSSTSSSYSRYGGYDTPFLVPVPIFFGKASLAEGGDVGSCVATDVSVIDPSGSCGTGGFNGPEGCGGTAGGVDGGPPPSRGYYYNNNFYSRSSSGGGSNSAS